MRDEEGRFIKGHLVPKKWKEISRDAHLGNELTEQHKRSISESNKGKKRSIEHRLNYRESKLGDKNPNYGKKYTKEERLRWSMYSKNIWKCMSHEDINKRNSKIREKRAKYIEEVGGSRIGKHENPILDYLEKCFNYPILRQYRVAGYFLDGYCTALNLAIEIDESHHKKMEQLKKDKYREKNIREELECSFLRLEV